MNKTAKKLDWNRMLGFEQISDVRESNDGGLGTTVGAKTGQKVGSKVGGKVGSKVGSKIGTKQGLKIAAKQGFKA